MPNKKPLIRLHCFGFAFTPYLIPTLGFLVLLPLLLKLGFWQLDRAQYKHQRQTQFETRQNATPLNITQINQNNVEELEYYPLALKGHYDNRHQFLLDNRIQNHRVGYDVLTPFILENSDKVVLINRGWIPSTGRQKLPVLPAVEGQQKLVGLVYMPSKKAFTLSNRRSETKWPLLIQTINLKTIKSHYNKPIYPFVVLLSSDNKHGFIRKWRVVSLKASKHTAYAIQWFAFAATLIIIFIVSNTRKQGERDEQEN